LQGVLLTHDAVVSTVAAVQAYLGQVTYGEKIDENHCMLSYLPLAHIFDR
jgi:long-subunit acyl-CoA synthetase (AMP-forming)